MNLLWLRVWRWAGFNTPSLLLQRECFLLQTANCLKSKRMHVCSCRRSMSVCENPGKPESDWSCSAGFQLDFHEEHTAQNNPAYMVQPLGPSSVLLAALHPEWTWSVKLITSCVGGRDTFSFSNWLMKITTTGTLHSLLLLLTVFSLVDGRESAGC